MSEKRLGEALRIVIGIIGDAANYSGHRSQIEHQLSKARSLTMPEVAETDYSVTTNKPDAGAPAHSDPNTIEQASFATALGWLRVGRRVSRKGWNGKGMWLYLVGPGRYPPQTAVAKAHFSDLVPYRPYIAMKTAQGDVVPWVASQSDLLEDDWVVEPERDVG